MKAANNEEERLVEATINQKEDNTENQMKENKEKNKNLNQFSSRKKKSLRLSNRMSISKNLINRSNSQIDQKGDNLSESKESLEEGSSMGDYDECGDYSNIRESISQQLINENLGKSDISINRHNFLLFFEILAKKENLIELSCFVFIRENHLVLISNILNSNKNLRKLHIRNMQSTLNSDKNELDIAFHIYNSLGHNIKDEFYILFNQINQLHSLEKLKLTHFSFNSDINYLACQTALMVPSLMYLNLSENHGIINNYLNVEENYNLNKSNLKKINFGNVYFHMIRNFDSIINPEKLKIAEMGVFDSISLSSFLNYCNQTKLEKIKLTLNKACGIDTLELLLKILSNYIFEIKNLKYFYLKNTYTNDTYDKYQNLIKEWVQKLFFDKFKNSKNLRKISLNHRKRATYIVNDRMYLKEKNIIIRLLILFVLQNKFKNNFDRMKNMFKHHIDIYPDKKEYYLNKYSNFKENIFKRVILLESGKAKKLTI